jgi:hypothetical protein
VSRQPVSLTLIMVSAPARLQPEYESKLVARLQTRYPYESLLEVRRHVDATLQFLEWCTLDGAPPLGPCPEVDRVWHEMLMFTADYRGLCRALGVQFIDHEPIEAPNDQSPSAARTLEFVRTRGIEPRHRDLWSYTGAAKCCGGHIAA